MTATAAVQMQCVFYEQGAAAAVVRVRVCTAPGLQDRKQNPIALDSSEGDVTARLVAKRLGNNAAEPYNICATGQKIRNPVRLVRDQICYVRSVFSIVVPIEALYTYDARI